MPYSLKQLDQRYQNICNNLEDAKEYTLQHLKATIHQCRVAIRNEKSPRLLEDEIQRKTNKNTEKTMQRHAFKLKRRSSYLRKATPYPMQSEHSIGH